MSFPIPTLQNIFEQMASSYEQALQFDKQGNPRIIDARSPGSSFAAQAKTQAMALYEVYLYCAYIEQQMMPDTATDWLVRHGTLWGVTREGSTKSVGNIILQAPAGTVIPSGIIFALSGVQWITSQSVTVPAGASSVSVPLVAFNAGASGNLPAGTQLTTLSPLLSLTSQIGVVDASGIQGGSDIESISSWRARIIERIQEPPCGGAFYDYIKWVKDVLKPARINVMPAWTGAGTVGVAFLMPDPTNFVRVPTSAEITEVQNYLNTVAPVTAQVEVIAGQLETINFSVAINPNTQAMQAAVTASIAAYMQSGEVGLNIEFHPDRLTTVIDLTPGLLSSTLNTPSGKIAANPVQMLVPGTFSFGSDT